MRSVLRVKTCVLLDAPLKKATYSSKRLEKPEVDTDLQRARGSQQSLDRAVIQETGEITSTSEQAWQ